MCLRSSTVLTAVSRTVLDVTFEFGHLLWRIRGVRHPLRTMVCLPPSRDIPVSDAAASLLPADCATDSNRSLNAAGQCSPPGDRLAATDGSIRIYIIFRVLLFATGGFSSNFHDPFSVLSVRVCMVASETHVESCIRTALSRVLHTVRMADGLSSACQSVCLQELRLKTPQ